RSITALSGSNRKNFITRNGRMDSDRRSHGNERHWADARRCRPRQTGDSHVRPDRTTANRPVWTSRRSRAHFMAMRTLPEGVLRLCEAHGMPPCHYAATGLRRGLPPLSIARSINHGFIFKSVFICVHPWLKNFSPNACGLILRQNFVPFRRPIFPPVIFWIG